MSAAKGASLRSLFESAKQSPFRTCQWPSGDPQDLEAFSYCGAPTLPPHSYCAAHVKQAYRDPDEEREAARAAA